MSDEPQQIALDPVAMHLNRKAKFFENEALILASQVRDLLAIVQAQPQVVVDEVVDPEPAQDLQGPEGDPSGPEGLSGPLGDYMLDA